MACETHDHLAPVSLWLYPPSNHLLSSSYGQLAPHLPCKPFPDHLIQDNPLTGSIVSHSALYLPSLPSAFFQMCLVNFLCPLECKLCMTVDLLTLSHCCIPRPCICDVTNCPAVLTALAQMSLSPLPVDIIPGFPQDFLRGFSTVTCGQFLIIIVKCLLSASCVPSNVPRALYTLLLLIHNKQLYRD